MKNDTPELGKLIDGHGFRDAIHIAICPITAGTLLRPGEHVGLSHEGEAMPEDECTKAVGIVDPFLRHDVVKGQRFWLCLYQNTVTSLRHAWTAPGFEIRPPAKEGMNAR